MEWANMVDPAAMAALTLAEAELLRVQAQETLRAQGGAETSPFWRDLSPLGRSSASPVAAR